MDNREDASFFFDKKRLNLSLCSTNLSRAKLAVYHTLGLGSYYIGLGLVSFYQKKSLHPPGYPLHYNKKNGVS